MRRPQTCRTRPKLVQAPVNNDTACNSETDPIASSFVSCLLAHCVEDAADDIVDIDVDLEDMMNGGADEPMIAEVAEVEETDFELVNMAAQLTEAAVSSAAWALDDEEADEADEAVDLIFGHLAFRALEKPTTRSGSMEPRVGSAAGQATYKPRSSAVAPRPFCQDGEYEEVLSLASDDFSEEQESSLAAARYMHAAMGLVRKAVQAAEVASDVDDSDDEGHWEMEERIEDEHELIQDHVIPTDEWVFDYVCGLLDDGLEECAQAAVASQEASLPAASSLTACSHSSFTRVLRPSGQQAAAPAQTFPRDSLPSAPAHCAPPRPAAVDWAALKEPAELMAPLDLSPASSPTSLELSPTSSMASPVSPSRRGLSSSRSRRRIIGGVVRGVSEAESARAVASSPAASPTASLTASAPSDHKKQAKAHKKSLGAAVTFRLDGDDAHKKSLGAAVTFRLDGDDDISFGRPKATAEARESSLVKGYDALGAVEFHSMDAGEDLWRLPAFTAKPAASLKGSRSLSSSGLGASRGFSAMEMDLGGLGAPSAPLKELNLGRPSSRSSSTGALRVTKAPPQALADLGRKGSGLLPALPGTPTGGSVAWSMHMARTRRSGIAAAF